MNGLILRERGTVVSAATTWKGHSFEHYSDGRFVVRDRATDNIVASLTGTTVESRDGEVFRVVGLDEAGAETIWRAVRQCARCSSPAVYETPRYDVPT